MDLLVSEANVPTPPPSPKNAMSAINGPNTLNPEQQKEVFRMLHSHMYVIFNAPATEFHNYPFQWDMGEGAVTITAIIEHFDKEQQAALIDCLNKALEGYRFSSADSASVSTFLKATMLERYEGGIQFVSNPLFPHINVMEKIKRSKCGHLWDHINTYEDFLELGKIKFQNDPFGSSGVSVVRFIAYSGTPLCVMLWLLRQLYCVEASDECGFGEVIITQRNGLPFDGDELNLHFNNGLIIWE